MARRDVVTEPAPPAPMPAGRETLDDLAAEAAGAAAVQAEAEAAAAAPPPPPEPALEVTGACVVAVSIVGGIICDRAGVDALSQAEADGLGRAVAGVLALYLPADALDPVTARWFALAGALAAVAVPRMASRSSRSTPAAPSVAPPVVRPYADGPMPPGPLLG